VLSSGYYEAYYAKAQKVRTLLKQDFLNAFQICDAIVTPTSPSTAFKIGEKSDDPLAMYLSDVYTASANLAGIPGISIPCGLSSENLPIGVQILGTHWSENALLRLANAYESEFPLSSKPTVYA
jgi:aspartyl-tRNA(Asn)/glutamyl-tRNA(Gln) amidotransferase subunit A